MNIIAHQHYTISANAASAGYLHDVRSDCACACPMTAGGLHMILGKWS